MIRSAPVAGVLMLAICLSAAAAEQCHIHAPADYPSFGGKPLVIPSVGDTERCQELNTQRFSGRGRCHCSNGLKSVEAAAPPQGRSPDRARPESLP